ncbi:MAG: hypothetical protein KF703_14590 [Actinobacteria bacterium]|nr:hypothetical protein [Actinomycetota bacterium]
MPTPTSPRRLVAAVALVAALAPGLVACSDHDDAAPSTTTAAAAATTTTAAGSGDGDPDAATEADYVAALEANFGRSGDVFSEEGVACLAQRWVEIIGVDTFHDAGVTPDELARNRADLGDLEMGPATAESLADSFDRCGLALRDAYLKTLEGDLSEQGKICVDEMLTPEVVRKAFVAELLGQELDPDPLLQVERCTR